MAFIIFWLMPMIACYYFAKDKNRNKYWWAIGGLMFSWIAVLFVALSSKREQPVIY